MKYIRMRELYKADWNDPSYPKIVKSDDREEGQSFTTVKKEILSSVAYSLKHWRAIAKSIRACKKEEVIA